MSFHKGKYSKVIAILTAMSALNVVNYLHPIIGMHILPVVVCKFPKADKENLFENQELL